ncbi:MAG: hypothetical protein FWE33_07220 [Defluviitaleaceae bacterium]|nr:hypothetical protein [Defluviitaleaceae bacterium]
MEDFIKAIEDLLQGETQVNAQNFASFAKESEIEVKNADGNLWEANWNSKRLCYIWLDGAGKKPGPWTIWLEGDYSNFPCDLDNATVKKAWENVNLCTDCGGKCTPGTTKTIFGKSFEGVCSSPIAFTNPDKAAIECVKKILLTRQNKEEMK